MSGIHNAIYAMAGMECNGAGYQLAQVGRDSGRSNGGCAGQRHVWKIPIQTRVAFGCKGFLKKDLALLDCWRTIITSKPGLELCSLDVGG